LFIVTCLLMQCYLVAVPCRSSASASSTDLYFSEYVEGSSNNKALEIYNGTGADIDLGATGYSIRVFFNGSTSSALTIPLTGTIAPGAVYVVAHASADKRVLAIANLTNDWGWYNGDDAVVLYRGETMVDIIGQIGFDPGDRWGSGSVTTTDHALVRKPSIVRGDTNGSDAFDPSVEWTAYPANDFSHLGTHTASSEPTEAIDVVAPVISLSSPGNGSTVSVNPITVSGTVTDNVGVTQLLIGPGKVDVLPNGSFTTTYGLTEGTNTVAIVAYDAAGNKGTATVMVTYAPPAPNTTVLALTIGTDVVTVNDKATVIDAAPEIVGGRTCVPIRFISESFGAIVEWQASTQGITITLGDHTVGLQIASRSGMVNGSVIALDAAPYIKNGRTMVPLRVISEAFGAEVLWNAATRTVTITYVP
jgi:hypothetical protein